MLKLLLNMFNSSNKNNFLGKTPYYLHLGLSIMFRNISPAGVLRVLLRVFENKRKLLFFRRTHCIFPVVTLLLVGNSSTMRASLLLVSWDRDLPEKQSPTHSVYRARAVNNSNSVLRSSRFSGLSFQILVMA